MPNELSCNIHGRDHYAWVSNGDISAWRCLKCDDLDPDILEGSRSEELFDKINQVLNSPSSD